MADDNDDNEHDDDDDDTDENDDEWHFHAVLRTSEWVRLVPVLFLIKMF